MLVVISPHSLFFKRLREFLLPKPGCGKICVLALFLSLFSVAGNSAATADEQLLDQARWAEHDGNYPEARRLYQRYLETSPELAVRQSLSIRISVLDEVARFGADPALVLFLEALSARDSAEYETAVTLLKQVHQQHQNSYLHDDATYLIGYISLLDLYHFSAAHDYFRQLLIDYPESRYIDTALYSEAIALEQLGNTAGARKRFLELRARHTEFSVGFLDQHWPRGTILSRYWFDRASKRIDILDARFNDAARMTEKQVLVGKGQSLRVTVDLDGMALVLLLSPSSATTNAVLKDRNNLPVEPSQSRYFSGVVEGDESSWARVAITGDAIEGVVSMYGSRYILEPETMIGTIDYYQPKLSAGKNDATGLQDYLMHPPTTSDTAEITSRVFGSAEKTVSSNYPVTRVAKIAVVVDSQFNDYYGGNGLSRALSVLNIADGIYREDFGLALDLSTAVVFTDRDSDPMNLGAVTLEHTLRQFRDYRLANTADIPGVSLVYLFSGNQNTDEAIGLAWIGGACRTDGYDVGVTTPSLYGDLLMAHELGHSLGAQHDSETSCASNTNQLMWPRISASTQQAFTACSRDVVTPSIVYGCYSDALDLALEIRAANGSNVEIIVRNNDFERSAQDAVVSIEHTAVEFVSLPPQCYATNGAQLECRTGPLAPGATMSLNFQLGEMLGSSMTLLAELTPVGFSDVLVGNNAVQLDARITDQGDTDITIASIASAAESIDSASDGTQVSNRPAGAAAGGSLSWLLLVLSGVVFYRVRVANTHTASVVALSLRPRYRFLDR